MTKHRGDVQTLRGLAVLLVVLYHLGLTRFGSGFLGVDVFFVISGYLMAVMYDPRQPLTFFRRRAWRLLPAYFVTVVATLVATALLATPNEVDQVADQAWQALTFTSNFWFWFGESYWDTKEFRPLLHLWSLAVEMQFYLLVPLVALLARRFRLAGILTLAALSAVLCFALLATSPKTSFFWLPTRMWAFLIGFAVGMALGTRTVDRPGAPGVGLAALIVIASIPLIPIEGEDLGFLQGHPGLAALAVTLATATVIACGIPARIQSLRLMRGLAALGDASYSIYLAHYPAVVLFLYQPFAGTITQSDSPRQLAWATAWVAVTSILLYRFVEKPLRHRSPARPLLVGASTTLLAIAIATPWIKTATLTDAQRPIFAARFDRDAFRCGKAWRALHPAAATCPINEPQRPVLNVFLVGNSHADALKRVMIESANTLGIRLYLTVENYPLMTQGRLGTKEILDHARRQGASALLLHYSPGAVDPAKIVALVEQAAGQGIATSYLMPVPSPIDNVPRLMWDAARLGGEPPLATLDDYRREHAALASALAGIRVPGFRVYEVAQHYCTPACAISSAAGVPYYYDRDHMTVTGSRLLQGTLSRMLADVVASHGDQSARAP